MADQGFIGGHGDALEPLGITFIVPNGSIAFQYASDRARRRTKDYLADAFGVYIVALSPPFLVLEFVMDDAPGPGNLPYSIGGFIPVWRTERGLDFCLRIARLGSAAPRSLRINSAMFPWEYRDKLKRPNVDQLTHLANTAFPEAEAFTVLSQELIMVELPDMNKREFAEKLRGLPMYHQNLPWAVEWHNGPLIRRGGDATSGAARGSNPDRVLSAEETNPKFDKLNSESEQVRAKKLLKQSEISINDRFMVEGLPPGQKRHVTAVGFRAVVNKGSQGCRHDSHADQKPAAFESTVVVKQGIYATHSTKRAKEPLVEGSLLVRSQSAREPTASEEEVVARGEVAGRLRFVVPEFEDSVRGLLCYADCLDDLIEEELTTVRLLSRALGKTG